MKKLVKKIFRRKITLMFVPHGRALTHQIKISLATFIGVAGLFLVAFLVAGISLFRLADYQKIKSSNVILKEKSVLLANEITEVRNTLKISQELDNRVKRMLGVSTKKIPPDASARTLAQMVGDDTVSREKMEKCISEIKLTGWLRKKDFQEVCSVAASTPMGSPIKGGWITSGFGYRRGIGHDIGAGGSRLAGMHNGVDLAQQTGILIRATASGWVSFGGVSGGYGKLVIISHGCGYSTRYAHCSKIKVKAGEKVKRGQVIALVGQTGTATGPHVHYEIRRYGKAINPSRYLQMSR